jgi:uncharacterized protein
VSVKYEWDENKRLSNLEKHHLDFHDAMHVYGSEQKLTYCSRIGSEERFLAMAPVKGTLYCLVYMHRGMCIRVISLRKASRQERSRYEQDIE